MGKRGKKKEQLRKVEKKAVVEKEKQGGLAKPRKSSSGKKGSLSSLQEALQKKLHGAQFRMLNEELYTKSGGANFERFSRDPSLAAAYHRGFREQAERWPWNPLDGMIQALGRETKRLVVADMGCGDARLAAELARHDVRSFDLVSTKPGVVACDIANVPLRDASVDVVVFCLALMGPSFWDFLKEGHRILRPAGILRIAEVRSRFDEPNSGFDKFEAGLNALGFDKKARDASNKMFVTFLFQKSPRRPPNLKRLQALNFSLKPCLYKRR